MSVGTGLMGSRSVACVTTETLSGSEEEEDVILSLTEMVGLCFLFTEVAVWLSGNVVGYINEVTLRRAGLVLRWVTVLGYTMLVFNQTTQPGHPCMGQNEYW